MILALHVVTAYHTNLPLCHHHCLRLCLWRAVEKAKASKCGLLRTVVMSMLRDLIKPDRLQSGGRSTVCLRHTTMAVYFPLICFWRNTTWTRCMATFRCVRAYSVQYMNAVRVQQATSRVPPKQGKRSRWLTGCGNNTFQISFCQARRQHRMGHSNSNFLQPTSEKKDHHVWHLSRKMVDGKTPTEGVDEGEGAQRMEEQTRIRFPRSLRNPDRSRGVAGPDYGSG